MPLDLLTITEHLFFRWALAGLVVASLFTYWRVNKRSARGDVVTTWLDNQIPFWTLFSIPYLLFLPYLGLVVIYGIVATPYYAPIAISVLAVQLAAVAVYWWHQTHVPRPRIAKRDWLARLTALIYRHDKPYCTYPSLHVAYSLLCAYWAVLIFPAWAPMFVALSVAIILSTLFLKQHAIVDVIGGVSLAVLSLMVLT